MTFNYHMPTQIKFGTDIIASERESLRLGRHAFIVTGKNSGRLSGALSDVTDALSRLSIAFTVFQGIDNNPNVEQCKMLASQARLVEADFIIGIGGGSPLDAAKAIAVFALNDIPCTKIFQNQYDNGVLPIAAVPTTSGTGSEVTPWSILTVDEWRTKRSFGCVNTFPRIAFLDPRYTYNTPIYITRNTAMDAMTHAFESIIAIKASPLTDAVNLHALSMFSSCMAPLEHGDVEPLREKLMLISLLAGTTIANTGTTLMHALGYPVTYFMDIPHGHANAIVMPTYLEELRVRRSDRLQIALRALNISYDALVKYLLKNYPVPFERKNVEIGLWAKQAASASSTKNTGIAFSEEDLYSAYARIWR